MIIEAVRLVVTLATTAAGFVVGRSIPDWFDSAGTDPDAAIVVGAVIGAGVGYVAGGLLGRSIRRGLDRAPELASRATGPELFAGAFGLLIGVVVGAVASIPVVILLPPLVGWSIASLLVIVLAAFGSRVFAARADDVLVATGVKRRTPFTPSATSVDAYVIDTSAAIDGRVLDLARAGLVGGDVVVAEFMVDELQGIADSGNKNRRRRGRRGLDVLDAIAELPSVELRVTDRTFPEHDGVDAKLVAMCLESEATLVTTDHNLAKAAGVRGIRVLNPHALGESLRPALTAGESVELFIEREGSEPGQGVGFLDDGTMVVVEGASSAVGRTIEVEVASALRTSVGRMLFAKLEA